MQVFAAAALLVQWVMAHTSILPQAFNVLNNMLFGAIFMGVLAYFVLALLVVLVAWDFVLNVTLSVLPFDVILVKRFYMLLIMFLATERILVI